MAKEENRRLNDNKVNPPSSAEAPHFVLIHGIGGGAWCWYKIRCLMENSGYKVTCLDLKGAGIDHTDPNTILSFQDYNQPLLHFLSTLPDNHQVCFSVIQVSNFDRLILQKQTIFSWFDCHYRSRIPIIPTNQLYTCPFSDEHTHVHCVCVIIKKFEKFPQFKKYIICIYRWFW